MISALVRLFIQFQTHILWLDLLTYFVLMSAVIAGMCGFIRSF
jgi:hypothetical protein